VVIVELFAGHRLHRQEITGGANLQRRPVGDRRQGDIEVSLGDQVRRRGEHALQAFGHRRQLLLERQLLRRAGRLVVFGRLRVPGHAVATFGGAEHGTLVVLHRGLRQPEQDRRLGEQPFRPGAVVPIPGEPLAVSEAELGKAGPYLQHLLLGDRAELRGADGHRAIGLLGRAERAQQRGHRGGVEPDGGGFTEMAGEVRITGDRLARLPQRHRFVVGHPVADVEQVLGGAANPGLLEQPRDRLVATEVAQIAEHHRGHRAREVCALGGRAGVVAAGPSHDWT